MTMLWFEVYNTFGETFWMGHAPNTWQALEIARERSGQWPLKVA